jgi:monovalent cation:H+ antiporter-2, CPA2 family
MLARPGVGAVNRSRRLARLIFRTDPPLFMQQHGLILTLVAALGLAFIFGMLAQRLRLSPIVGYLVAGMAVGPFTPGFTANLPLTMELAEIGVILLMFGVGLKFSIDDLLAVRGLVLPGALGLMTITTGLGTLLGASLGMSLAEGLALGFAMSVASTAVLLRSLEDRKLLQTPNGRICVGWLVIEDMAIVLGIVLTPALAALAKGEGAGTDPVALIGALGVTIGKIALFVTLMLVVGGRFFPWLIIRVAHMRSRELLSLGSLALALSIAAAAYFWFGASFALGAFLAGLVLNGTKLSHRVAEDSLPLRDTFAVIFFVSVGMLFDPSVVWKQPLALLGVALIIIVGKSAGAFAITRVFGQPLGASMLVATSLAQIGEFSFVFASLARSLGVMTDETYNLILGGALVSIALNPFLFNLAQDRAEKSDARHTPPEDKPAAV